jgi:hypothetical protein
MVGLGRVNLGHRWERSTALAALQVVRIETQ